MVYDPSIRTDLNWVRLKIQDTNDSPNLQDTEIDFLLGEEPNKWYAAAAALDAIKAKRAALGGGLVEKRVEDLELRFGGQDSAGDAIDRLIETLRREGARRLAGTSRFPFLQTLGDL